MFKNQFDVGSVIIIKNKKIYKLKYITINIRKKPRQNKKIEKRIEISGVEGSQLMKRAWISLFMYDLPPKGTLTKNNKIYIKYITKVYMVANYI